MNCGYYKLKRRGWGGILYCPNCIVQIIFLYLISQQYILAQSQLHKGSIHQLNATERSCSEILPTHFWTTLIYSMQMKTFLVFLCLHQVVGLPAAPPYSCCVPPSRFSLPHGAVESGLPVAWGEALQGCKGQFSYSKQLSWAAASLGRLTTFSVEEVTIVREQAYFFVFQLHLCII